MLLFKLLFYICFFLLAYAMLFNIAGIIFRIPSKRITKTLRRASAAVGKKGGSDINRTLAISLSKLVYINEYKRETMSEKLAIADIDETPEMYTAQGILLLLECAILAIGVSFLSPIFAITPTVLGIYLFVRHKNILKYAVRDLQEQIDMDLPRFVYSMRQESKTSHDVLSLLERHKNDYSDHWRRQMDITVSDMRSGNYDVALQRLEGRVGSANLSEVIRGLIEMAHGSDMHVYWETLQVRFSELRKSELRKAVRKIPERVHNLSLWLILAMLLIYIVVFGSVLADSLALFG